MTDRSDEELFAAYVAGDREAFEALFRRYAPQLLRLFRRSLWRPQDAEELVQETFLRAHRAASDFHQGKPLRPWLFTIALNLKREYIRRKARRPEAALELDGRRDPSHTPEPMREQDAAREVRRALDTLPDSQREVIELHWLAEMPFPEVAVAVGASLSAVKVRAPRGYKKMRSVLEGA